MPNATAASRARQLPLFAVPLEQGELVRERAPRAPTTLEYFVGAHRPHWLALSSEPLFVSHRTLGPRKSLPRARARWALDSGGFSELKLFGGWRTTPRAYAQAVRRYRDEIGGLVFASQQDWMCEPFMLHRTGLSLEEHQRRTVNNYLELQSIAPDLPWLPVLQGWSWGSYMDCQELFARAGVALEKLPRVGVGSICRRQSTTSAHCVLGTLASEGVRLHAFGLKLQGLKSSGGFLASADSMAWSYAARREHGFSEWQIGRKRTGAQNSLDAALDWFGAKVASLLERGFCQHTGFVHEPHCATASALAA